MLKTFDEMQEQHIMDFIGYEHRPTKKKDILIILFIFWLLDLLAILIGGINTYVILFTIGNLYLTYFGILVVRKKGNTLRKGLMFWGNLLLYLSYSTTILNFSLLKKNINNDTSYWILLLLFFVDIIAGVIVFYYTKQKVLKGNLSSSKKHSAFNLGLCSVISYLVIRMVLMPLIKKCEYGDIIFFMIFILCSVYLTCGITSIMKSYYMKQLVDDDKIDATFMT